MNNAEEDTLVGISRKLDLILGLLLKLRPQPDSEKETALALLDAGLSVQDVARTLGKSSNAIRLYVSRNRKR